MKKIDIYNAKVFGTLFMAKKASTESKELISRKKSISFKSAIIYFSASICKDKINCRFQFFGPRNPCFKIFRWPRFTWMISTWVKKSSLQKKSKESSSLRWSMDSERYLHDLLSQEALSQYLLSFHFCRSSKKNFSSSLERDATV